jgi:hypothetical protein
MRKTSSAIGLVEEWCIDRPASGGRGTVSDKIWGAWRPTWILVYLCYDVFEEQGMQRPTATIGGPFERFCYATYDLALGCDGPRVDLMRDIKSVCGQRKGEGDSDRRQRESLADQRQEWLALLERMRSGEWARQIERLRRKYADRASAPPQVPKTRPAAPHPLERLAELADFEELRPDLAAALDRFGGEKDALLPHDPVLLFKILVLRALYGGLSCEEAERQIRDRRSFRRFLQLDDEGEVPNAAAISLFREALRETGELELLSCRLVSLLKERGFEVEQQGQIFEPVLREP